MHSALHIHRFPAWTKNTVFDLWLIESTDGFKSRDREGCLFIEKNLIISGSSKFKPMFFKGQLYWLRQVFPWEWGREKQL